MRLTHLGLFAERVTHAFWPAWTALFLAGAVWASGLVPDLWEFSLIAALLLLALVLIVLGARAFRMPTRADARARLDATLPGRPLTALSDDLAVGSGDHGAAGVWAAHRERMAARLAGARAVRPDLRVSRRDPYALRYVALLLLAVALGFGTLWRAPVIPDMPGIGRQVATGPAWEGWLEPPRHTGLPTLYLNEIAPGQVEVPEGTQVTLRLYGEVGALAVSETVSGRDMTDPGAPIQDFEVVQSGTLSIDGGTDAPIWALTATPDTPPAIALNGTPTFEHPDMVLFPWGASDDYGVVSAEVTFALDPEAAGTEHGLAIEPEPRAPLTLDMALPISGDRSDFTETLRAELTKHPLAGMPVTATLSARDAAGQEGRQVEGIVLPARPFYEPVASALIEQRRDLFWSRANRDRVARLLRAVTWKADGTWDNPTAYLIVRMAIRRLDQGPLTLESRDEIAEMLWEAAVRLEGNSLDSALERLRQAQDRLSEAIRQGAPPEEIERLMAEMRQAMDDYTRQLAQQGPQQGQNQQQAQGETQEITPDMLDQMMERIEELMQQGRTAEAQELLRQLQEMMENMQVTQGQGSGQGQPGEGEQAMDELRDQLREQQGLSDEAFRELQEQFNPNAQAGESGENEGSSGGQGRGTEHTPGQGQQGQEGESRRSEAPGQGGGAGQQPGTPGEGADARTLAERQQALRRGLETLRDGLPAAGTEAGDAAREALGRAEEAMREAERDLAEGNLGGALDDQARAMDALRDGMQELGRALAGDRPQDRPGENRGQAGTRDGQGLDRDPLGRRSGQGGQLGTDENLLGDADAAQRARDLMDEIRRRSGERNRPKLELDYLRRLLDRF
nr:TIGR02302 family protein [Jannaschia sp. S6380]